MILFCVNCQPPHKIYFDFYKVNKQQTNPHMLFDEFMKLLENNNFNQIPVEKVYPSYRNQINYVQYKNHEGCITNDNEVSCLYVSKRSYQRLILVFYLKSDNNGLIRSETVAGEIDENFYNELTLLMPKVKDFLEKRGYKIVLNEKQSNSVWSAEFKSWR